MEYRVIMNEDKKRNLNVWVDNIKHKECYCNSIELQMLFYLSIKERGYNCSQAILNDFVKTCEKLKDFCFRLTDTGIEYFDLGGNAKNMAIYKGEK